MMSTYYMEGIYIEVEGAVKRVQRHLRRGVLPKHVQPYLPFDRAEGSVRRDMRQMWLDGRLCRVGLDGSRRGYRLATMLEKWIERNLLIFLERRRFGFLIAVIS